MQRITTSVLAIWPLFFFCLVVARDITNQSALAAKTSVVVDSTNHDLSEIREEAAVEYVDRDNDNQWRVLSRNEFAKYAESLKLVNGEKCKKDLNATLWGIVERQPWAISMWDATVKSPVGIESGSIYQFGQFDECMDLNAHPMNSPHPHHLISTKYCLAEVIVEGLSIQKIASRKYKPSNSTLVHWGICVPGSCGSDDIQTFMGNFLEREIRIDNKFCNVHEEFQPTTGMLIYGAVIISFILMALISTIYHAYLLSRDGDSKDQNDPFEVAMKAFSIIENVNKMLQASKDSLGLNSINGIKALAMMLIITGHALSFVYSGPVLNSDFMEKDIKQVQNAFLTNSLLFVDSFLLLSGFLFCRILLIELERRRGRVNVIFLYIGRYVRLTPAYLAVLMFYITWFPEIGSGPLWNSRIVLEQERCSETWWLNILYINNYFKTDNLCMFQSWYLSVDSQLFLVAPIVIFLLYSRRRIGIALLTVMAMVTIIIPLSIIYAKNLDPTLMVYVDEVTDFASNPFYVGTYIKTHMRAAVYVFGLITGFIVHLMQERNTKLPNWLVSSLWIISAIVGTASMYCITIFYSKPYSNLEGTLYGGFHKIGWSLSVGWMVIAVTTGHAQNLQSFLSSRFFAPLSRLTYCAYLSNGIVEMYHAGSIRTPIYMSRLSMLNVSVSHTFDTFLLALIICLLFESPIHALERVLLRGEKRKHGTVETRKDDSSNSPSTSEENY